MAKGVTGVGVIEPKLRLKVTLTKSTISYNNGKMYTDFCIYDGGASASSYIKIKQGNNVFDLIKLYAGTSYFNGHPFIYDVAGMPDDLQFEIYSYRPASQIMEGTVKTIDFVDESVKCFNGVGLFAQTGLPYSNPVTPDEMAGSANKGMCENSRYIESVTIPEHLLGIGGRAFYGCIALDEVIFNEVEGFIIGPRAFQGTALVSVDLSGYTGLRFLYSSRPTQGGGDYGYVDIARNGFTFTCCTSLTTVILPSDLENIYGGMFEFCPALENITFPTALKVIDGYAFNGCTSITSLVLPEGLTQLDVECFAGCTSLTSVTLPSTLTLLNEGQNSKGDTGVCAVFKGCSNLQEVICLATTPPTMDEDDVFDNCHANLVIKVPAASVSAYQSATNWSYYSAKIQAI